MELKESGNEYTNEERYIETEEFLNQYLPQENPTEEEYIHAYTVIEALRESKHPHRREEHQQLAMAIEKGLPYTPKGFNLLVHQIHYETESNMPRSKSLVDSVVFLDFEKWQNGYPAHRLWRMITQEEQTEGERETTERIIWKLQMYSFGLYKQMNEEYTKESERVEEENMEKEGKKKPLPILPKKFRDKANNLVQENFLSLPNHLDELKEDTDKFYRLTTYFESLNKIFKNPEDIFVDFDKNADFWMSKDGEIILTDLLTSKISSHRDTYYKVVQRLTEFAQKKEDTVMIGRVGTRHAMRISRVDPFSRDFTQIEYWRGIKLPKREDDIDNQGIGIPKKYDGDNSNGFRILRALLQYGDQNDSMIYKTTMQAFLKYIEDNKSSIKDYEVTKNFFQTQYSFDLIFNLKELEREVEEETSFDFVLRKYLWLKYGPKYIDENPTSFEIKLWNLQRDILLKGIKIFEDLFDVQKIKGQNEYEIHRDFYQEAKNDLEEQYTENAWHLIMFTTRNFNTEKEIFRKSFENFKIDIDKDDEKLFYLAVLLGTLDFAITIKQTENLKKVGASSLRYLYGTKPPTAFEEVSQKAQEELERWRFRKDEKDLLNPTLKFDNNIFNSLRNLSITWGRGYGASVVIEQEGVLIKNPLHTMGEEKEIFRDGKKVKERPNRGGRDEVLIPWEIIAKAIPQFDYIPWADSILRLVGQYRANVGRRDLDWVSDLTSRGPAVIRFEAAGSERMYELPPLPNAKNIAKILKEIAAQMIVVEIPHPKDILTKIE